MRILIFIPAITFIFTIGGCESPNETSETEGREYFDVSDLLNFLDALQENRVQQLAVDMDFSYFPRTDSTFILLSEQSVASCNGDDYFTSIEFRNYKTEIFEGTYSNALVRVRLFNEGEYRSIIRNMTELGFEPQGEKSGDKISMISFLNAEEGVLIESLIVTTSECFVEYVFRLHSLR